MLKGAALFTVWTGRPHRATRDIDLLGFGEPGIDHVREVFAEVLALEVADDSVRFDVATLAAASSARIKSTPAFVSSSSPASRRQRCACRWMWALATPSRPTRPLWSVRPPLLDFPAPRLRAYPRETVVAEKFETMVQLGVANSRMKDFYDLAVLARDFDFDGALLTRAIQATFERRNTSLRTTPPVALTAAFAEDATKRTQWSGFARKAGVRDAGTLTGTVAVVRAFVEPLLVAAASDTVALGSWRPGGPWRCMTNRTNSVPDPLSQGMR